MKIIFPKNVPEVLKCIINAKVELFFFWWGGGGGGGGGGSGGAVVLHTPTFVCKRDYLNKGASINLVM